jgi:hypothetical protein
LAACIAFSTYGWTNASGQTQPAQPPSSRPLAYVRHIAVCPVEITEPELDPVPDIKGKDAKDTLKRREAAVKLRESSLALRQDLRGWLDQALPRGLAKMDGLIPDTATASSQAEPVWQRREKPTTLAFRAPQIRLDSLQAHAMREEATSALAVSIDEVYERTGIEREIGIRLVAYLLPTPGEPLRGPFVSVGWARALRKFTGKGFAMDDSVLSREAAGRALNALLHTLDTGSEMPFARNPSVAVLPCDITEPLKIGEGETSPSPIELPAIVRQRSVLLQPELPPFVRLAERQKIEQVLNENAAGNLWLKNELPDIAKLQTIGRSIRARFLFVSRISSLELTDDAIQVKSGEDTVAGTEREARIEAQAALVDTRSGVIVWTDRVEASARSRSEFVRGRHRLLTDEQVAVDASHAAFAGLRRSYDNYLRQFYR